MNPIITESAAIAGQMMSSEGAVAISGENTIMADRFPAEEAVMTADDLPHASWIKHLSRPGLNVFGYEEENEADKEKLYGLALGFFDGVHKGHQVLIDQLIWHSRDMDICPAVYTFDHLAKVHPTSAKGQKYLPHQQLRDWGRRIQTAAQRADFLAEKGVRLIIEQVFSAEFKHLTPLAFLDQLLRDRALALLVVGDDFRFGHNRDGDCELIKSWGAAHQIRIVIVPQVKCVGEAVSSSRIREYLSAGEMEKAQFFLGHPFALRGVVVPGRALGRTVGMPTANISLDRQQILLPFGVYMSRTRVGKRYYNSISNIGLRPTVNSDNQIPLLETYLFDMEEDLYGQELEVFLLSFQRAETRFSNLEAMMAVVTEDIVHCRRKLAERERLQPIAELGSVGYFHLPSTRFRQALLQVEIKIPADSIGNSARALAQRLLLLSSAAIPDPAAFSLKQDKLFGAALEGFVEREGNLQVLVFTADGILHGLHGEKPFHELSLLLLDALFHPDLDEGASFTESHFYTERENLLAELRARNQDKAKYAFDRSIDLLLTDRAEALSPRGNHEVLENLTAGEVTKCWFDTLRQAQINIFAAGDLKEDYHTMILQKLDELRLLGRADDLIRWPKSTMDLQPRPCVIQAKAATCEFMDLEQARLNVFFGGLPPLPLLRGAVLIVLNSLLGADSHSLLFTKIREEKAYAYSIYSQALIHQSMIMISAGIHPPALDSAIEDIRGVMRVLATQGFCDEDFHNAIAMAASKLNSLSDSLGGQLNYQISSLTLGHLQDSREALDYLENVSKEDVAKMASALSELFIYQLVPGGQNE